MAGHSHFSPSNVEEHFEFTAEGRKRVIYAFLAGLVALVVGIYLLSREITKQHTLLLNTVLSMANIFQEVLLLIMETMIGLIVYGPIFG